MTAPFAITQTHRSGWQRQAVAVLTTILDEHRDLPAIAWLVGPVGCTLVGRMDGPGPADQVRAAFGSLVPRPGGRRTGRDAQPGRGRLPAGHRPCGSGPGRPRRHRRRRRRRWPGIAMGPGDSAAAHQPGNERVRPAGEADGRRPAGVPRRRSTSPTRDDPVLGRAAVLGAPAATDPDTIRGSVTATHRGGGAAAARTWRTSSPIPGHRCTGPEPLAAAPLTAAATAPAVAGCAPRTVAGWTRGGQPGPPRPGRPASGGRLASSQPVPTAVLHAVGRERRSKIFCKNHDDRWRQLSAVPTLTVHRRPRTGRHGPRRTARPAAPAEAGVSVRTCSAATTSRAAPLRRHGDLGDAAGQRPRACPRCWSTRSTMAAPDQPPSSRYQAVPASTPATSSRRCATAPDGRSSIPATSGGCTRCPA